MKKIMLLVFSSMLLLAGCFNEKESNLKEQDSKAVFERVQEFKNFYDKETTKRGVAEDGGMFFVDKTTGDTKYYPFSVLTAATNATGKKFLADYAEILGQNAKLMGYMVISGYAADFNDYTLTLKDYQDKSNKVKPFANLVTALSVTKYTNTTGSTQIVYLVTDVLSLKGRSADPILSSMFDNVTIIKGNSFPVYASVLEIYNSTGLQKTDSITIKSGILSKSVVRILKGATSAIVKIYDENNRKIIEIPATVENGAIQIVLNSIYIKSNPVKTNYYVGETIDITGLVIEGVYSDNSTALISVTAGAITGFDSKTVGTKVLTVSAQNKTTTFSIVVSEKPFVTLASISIKSNPAKINYNVGDSLDITGLVVEGIYSDNSMALIAVTTGAITGFDSKTVGTKVLTVTIENKTATFSVDVSQVSTEFQKDYIYDDALGSLWITDTWSNPIYNISATFTGTVGNVIEVTHGAAGWDAFLLPKRSAGWVRHFMYMNQYKNLCFSFNPGSNLTNIEALRISAQDGGIFLRLVDLIPNWHTMTSAQKTNKWFEIKIPFTKLFSSANERFYQIILFDNSGSSLHYYLDNVYLEWIKDTTPPTISEVTSQVGLTYSDATITWKTDEYTKYVFEYGINDYSVGQIIANTDYASKSHSVKIPNLQPGTTYKYKITAIDIQTIQPVVNNSVYDGVINVKAAFTTPPAITTAQFTETSLTYAKLNLKTDRPTTVKIYYGTSVLNNSVENSNFATEHNLTLGALLPGTNYSYYAVIKDPFGNMTTGATILFASSNDYTKLKLHFEIDPATGKAPISPYIYGINSTKKDIFKEHNLGMGRLGGNRFTAYNWENNASNAGTDWYNQNDDYIASRLCDTSSEYDIPGSAIDHFITNVKEAGPNSGVLVTIPIQGYVAADKNGNGDVNQTTDYLNNRFFVSKARKDTGALSLTPNKTDKFVYQNEFVYWLKNKYPDTKLMYSLDNEPDLWSDTHPRIHPNPVTYDELVKASIDYASAIKEVDPQGMVFGPASYGWYGFVALQGASDSNGRDFLDYYLDSMKSAESKYNRRIVDVLDLHWYTEDYSGNVRLGTDVNTPAVAAARMQTTRSLWDSTFIENSWIARDGLNNQPVKLIPRMNEKIAAHYPDTKLAFTEYNFGGGSHISGAIAQADALGIFGKYNVYAATMWEMSSNSSFIYGAFDMFRNFDGAGGSFGDTSVTSKTNDFVSTSIYASTNAANQDKVVAVLINKNENWSDGDITIGGTTEYKTGTVYTLLQDSAIPKNGGTISSVSMNKFVYSLPPYSISTIVFTK